MPVVIIGCGLTGATLAHLFATRAKRCVRVIEKREHIGGQCYDFVNEYGLYQYQYGSHVFHTNNAEVWEFVNRFAEFSDYVHIVKSLYRGMYYDWPITLDTINTVYGTNLDAEGAKALLASETYDSGQDNFENAITKQIGIPLYEIFIKGFSERMWGLPACQLSSELAFRIPVRLDNDKRLFQDKFQGVPKYGYTQMVANMLDDPSIELILGMDWDMAIEDYDLLFVTSPIDEFFDYCYGRLAYRGMKFMWKTYEVESFQPAATVNLPDEISLLRRSEAKKIYQQASPFTSICYYYPSAEERYYPMMTDANSVLAERYKQLQTDRIHCVGRLGTYKYINMDEAILMAINKFKELT